MDTNLKKSTKFTTPCGQLCATTKINATGEATLGAVLAGTSLRGVAPCPASFYCHAQSYLGNRDCEVNGHGMHCALAEATVVASTLINRREYSLKLRSGLAIRNLLLGQVEILTASLLTGPARQGNHKLKGGLSE